MTLKFLLATAAVALGIGTAEAGEFGSTLAVNEPSMELGSRWRDYNYVPWQCYATLPRPRYCR
jgi:hypothetical protein